MRGRTILERIGIVMFIAGLSADEIVRLSLQPAFEDVLKRPPDERLQSAGGLLDWWLVTFDAPYKAATEKLAGLESESASIRKRAYWPNGSSCTSAGSR